MLKSIRSHIEIVLLTLLSGLSIVRPSLMPTVILVGAGFALWRILTTRKFAPRIPLELPLIGLLLLAILNWLFVTPDRAVTFPSLLQLLASVLLFFALLNWASTINRLMLVLCLVSLAGVLFAAVFPLISEATVPIIGRFVTPIRTLLSNRLTDTVNSNIIGGLLTLIFPLPFAWFLFSTRRVSQIIGLSAALFIGGMLFLSQSRGGLLATIVTIVVLFILRFGLVRYIIPLMTIIVGGIIVLFFVRPTLLANWLDGGNATVSLSGRIEIYSRSLYLLQDFPFTGVGMGIFGEVIDLLYPLFSTFPGTIKHAHNLFLQIGSELGLLALICWIAIELIVVFTVFCAYHYTSEPELRGISAAAFAAQLSFLLHGIIDAPLWNTRPAPFVWIIWGMAIASFLIMRQQNQSKIS